LDLLKTNKENDEKLKQTPGSMPVKLTNSLQ
jgi:hypothetical protein